MQWWKTLRSDLQLKLLCAIAPMITHPLLRKIFGTSSRTSKKTSLSAFPYINIPLGTVVWSGTMVKNAKVENV